MALAVAEGREAGQRSQRGDMHGERQAVAGCLLVRPGDDPGVVRVAGELAAIRHGDGQHDLVARSPGQLARSRIHRPAGRRYRLFDAQPGGLADPAAARDHAGNGRYGYARTLGHLGDRRRPVAVPFARASRFRLHGTTISPGSVTNIARRRSSRVIVCHRSRPPGPSCSECSAGGRCTGIRSYGEAELRDMTPAGV